MRDGTYNERPQGSGSEGDPPGGRWWPSAALGLGLLLGCATFAAGCGDGDPTLSQSLGPNADLAALVPVDCAPECEGLSCGDDGCGGVCGACDEGQGCADGACVVCTCDGKECGDDGCGTYCGDCPGAAPYCHDNLCYVECQPDCDGKTCGTDGCGGVCGSCPADVPCDDGICACEASCAGHECGDDGCGGSCGACDPSLACVEGTCMVCIPGTMGCAGGTTKTCVNDGSGWIAVENCAASGLACLEGECIPGCDHPAGLGSSLGCTFHAVDLDNVSDAANAPVGIVVVNASLQMGSVSLVSNEGAIGAVALETASLGPGESATLLLPAGNCGETAVHQGGYKVISEVPVAAFMFNPLTTKGVYSNDASLLLPQHALGTWHMIMSRFEIVGTGDDGEATPFRSTFSIVAVEPETEVWISPTAPTLPGEGVLALMPGETGTITLGPYQVLNIQSDGEYADLTGTEILSDKPIAVFSGHEGSVGGETCCVDHLEEQLPPVGRWGTIHVAAKAPPRGQENDYWRIVAAYDDTTVSFTPDLFLPVTLGLGEFVEFHSTESFVVTANQPVMVAQTLAGSQEVVSPPEGTACFHDDECATGYDCDFFYGCIAPSCSSESDSSCPKGHVCTCVDYGSGTSCECEPIGDPSLVLAPPIAAYQTHQRFALPVTSALTYVNIMMPVEAWVTVDGVELKPDNVSPIAGTGFAVGRHPVSHGVHVVEADAPVGVTVFGYDDDISFGYPAGWRF